MALAQVGVEYRSLNAQKVLSEMKDYKTAAGGIDAANRDVASSAKGAADAIGSTAAPVKEASSAEKELKTSTAATTAELVKQDGAVAELGREMDRTKAKVVPLRAAVAETKTAAGGFGRAFQQSGYQIQDFAVQVAGGTSALTAFAQQAPQLLGGLGVAGGVGIAVSALATLIAIGAAVYPAFAKASDGGKLLKDRLDDLAAASRDYSSSVDDALTPMADLRKQFGDQADEVRNLYRAMSDLAELKFLDTLTQASKAFQGSLGGIGVELDKIDKMQGGLTEGFNRALGEAGLRKEFGLTIEQAERVRTAYDALGQAQGPAQVATAAGQLLDALRSSADESGRLNPAMLAAAQQAADLQLEAVRASAGLKDSADYAKDIAAIDMASGISAAAGEAALLAASLGISLEAAKGIAFLKDQETKRPSLGFGLPSSNDNEVGDATLTFGSDPSTAGASRRIVVPEVKTPKGRKSGGKTQAEKDADAAKKAMESVLTPAEQYAAALKQLDDLHDKGKLSNSAYVRSVDALDDKFGTTKSVAQDYAKALKALDAQFDAGKISSAEYIAGVDKLKGEFSATAQLAQDAGSAMKTAFTGLFDDPQAALEQLAAQLAQLAAFQFLAKSFPSVFGSEGIIPLAGARAAGGPVAGGSAYLVGENGPEVYVPGSSGNIVPNHALGGSTVVNTHNYGRPEDVQVQETKGPDGETQIDVFVRKQISTGAYDGANRTRYGTRPQKVRY